MRLLVMSVVSECRSALEQRGGGRSPRTQPWTREKRRQPDKSAARIVCNSTFLVRTSVSDRAVVAPVRRVARVRERETDRAVGERERRATLLARSCAATARRRDQVSCAAGELDGEGCPGRGVQRCREKKTSIRRPQKQQRLAVSLASSALCRACTRCCRLQQAFSAP